MIPVIAIVWSVGVPCAILIVLAICEYVQGRKGNANDTTQVIDTLELWQPQCLETDERHAIVTHRLPRQ